MQFCIAAVSTLLMVHAAGASLVASEQKISTRAAATNCVPVGPADMVVEVNTTAQFYVRPYGKMTYPEGYNCGIILMGTGENKLRLKCVVHVLEGDHMVVISQGVQEVFTNTDIAKFYRVFNTPVVYVGFKAGAHSGPRQKQAFYCRVQG